MNADLCRSPFQIAINGTRFLFGNNATSVRVFYGPASDPLKYQCTNIVGLLDTMLRWCGPSLMSVLFLACLHWSYMVVVADLQHHVQGRWQGSPVHR